MRCLLTWAVAIVASALLAPVVSAHHSFAAEFDAKNCRDFTGVLTKLDWQNPHAYFYVDVKERQRARWNRGRFRLMR